jgi:predicted phosphoribosyltransferase
VPVDVVVAELLNIQFDVAVVSKITLPWNTEAGFDMRLPMLMKDGLIITN